MRHIITHNYDNHTGIMAKIAQLPHAVQGTWFGLPDFGITETARELFGKTPSAQATTTFNNPAIYADNQRLNQTPQATQQTAQRQKQGQVLGAQASMYAPPPPTPEPSGGGGNSGGGMSLREQMERGLIPWDDNRLAQENQPSSDEARRREEALRSTINSGFDDIMRQLDAQAGLLPGYQTQDEQSIKSASANLRTGIDEAYQNAQKSIDMTRGQIQSGVDKSVLDIQNSLRGLLRNAYNQVGAAGAGNSSAAQTMLPYAFSKMYGQQRGAIQGQANSQFTDLAKKELDVQTTFTQQKSSIDQWENEQLTQTRDKYRTWLSDINNAKVNASGQRLAALQSLETNLLNQAYNELNQRRSAADNFRTALAGWVSDRLGTLNNLKLELSNTASYNPSDIVYNELQGIGSILGGNGADFFANPLAFRRGDKDNNI